MYLFDIIKMIQTAYIHVWENVFYLNLLVALAIIFSKKKDPESAWAWIIFIHILPVMGIIIYLLIGANIIKEKMFRAKAINDQLHDIVEMQENSLSFHEMQRISKNIEEYSDLIYYNLDTMSSVLSDNNTVTHITEGKKKFELLDQDIKNAKKFIHMQYYIIQDDMLFDHIARELIAKAEQGVEVRILFDSVGSRSITNEYCAHLEKYHIQTGIFFEGFLRKFDYHMNYRNHRKIVVIDGDIGYVGGFNVGKEYLSLDKRFGHWRDTHMRIEGLAVSSLGIRFILDWNYTKKENLFAISMYTKMPRPTEGISALQVISSGPDSTLPHIRDNYLRMISKATESIHIQTPYFIPDEEIQTALLVAIHSGIKVHIMIPCKPDHPFVYWATRFYVGELVKAGAKCYTYEDGFLHSKGVIIDSRVYSYGTANFDIRSLHLNFEINVVNYSEEDAKDMVRLFEKDLEVCQEMTKEMYANRGIKIRYKEQVSRLIAPIL
ncbi:MAG: cardiolipin synthase [Eubacteriales bacterium]